MRYDGNYVWAKVCRGQLYVQCAECVSLRVSHAKSRQRNRSRHFGIDFRDTCSAMTVREQRPTRAAQASTILHFKDSSTRLTQAYICFAGAANIAARYAITPLTSRIELHFVIKKHDCAHSVLSEAGRPRLLCQDDSQDLLRPKPPRHKNQILCMCPHDRYPSFSMRMLTAGLARLAMHRIKRGTLTPQRISIPDNLNQAASLVTDGDNPWRSCDAVNACSATSVSLSRMPFLTIINTNLADDRLVRMRIETCEQW
jgi:hypothetical protein